MTGPDRGKRHARFPRARRYFLLSLRWKRPFRPIISAPCRQLTCPDDELAAVTVAIRHVIEGDRFPRAPRLDPLRTALAKL